MTEKPEAQESSNQTWRDKLNKTKETNQKGKSSGVVRNTDGQTKFSNFKNAEQNDSARKARKGLRTG